jgi:hypothetical protein
LLTEDEDGDEDLAAAVVAAGALAVLLALMVFTEPERARVVMALAGTTADNPPISGRLVVTWPPALATAAAA